MSTDPKPRPRKVRITVDLGVHGSKGRDYQVRLVVTSTGLPRLIQKAIENIDGRTELAGSAVVVLAKRIVPATVAKEEGRAP